MPSVIEVSDYHGPYAGSFVPGLAAVGTAVRERLGLGHVCVFTSVAAGRPWLSVLEAAGIPVEFVPGRAGARARARHLRAIARAHDAALLRSHFTALDLETAVVARATRAACVWHMHTGDLDFSLRRRARDLVKMRGFGAACDRIIAVSEDIARQNARRAFPERKIRVVLNGMELERFTPDRLPDRAAARRRLGLPAEARVALAFGWWPHAKGTDLLVRAGAEMGAAGHVLALVGGERMREAVRELVDPADAPWLRLIEPVQDARELYAAADAFVSASRHEGFSFAIGEAMAAGLPVVSSDIPGPAAYFDAPGITTFATEDVDALARAVVTALDAPDARRRGAANADFVRARFSMDRHVDGIIDVFRELVDPPPAAPLRAAA